MPNIPKSFAKQRYEELLREEGGKWLHPLMLLTGASTAKLFHWIEHLLINENKDRRAGCDPNISSRTQNKVLNDLLAGTKYQTITAGRTQKEARLKGVMSYLPVLIKFTTPDTPKSNFAVLQLLYERKTKLFFLRLEAEAPDKGYAEWLCNWSKILDFWGTSFCTFGFSGLGTSPTVKTRSSTAQRFKPVTTLWLPDEYISEKSIKVLKLTKNFMKKEVISDTLMEMSLRDTELSTFQKSIKKQWNLSFESNPSSKLKRFSDNAKNTIDLGKWESRTDLENFLIEWVRGINQEALKKMHVSAERMSQSKRLQALLPPKKRRPRSSPGNSSNVPRSEKE